MTEKLTILATGGGIALASLSAVWAMFGFRAAVFGLVACLGTAGLAWAKRP